MNLLLLYWTLFGFAASMFHYPVLTNQLRQSIKTLVREDNVMAYGVELIIDLYKCDISLFTRKHLRNFLVELCDLIEMQREDLYFWDYEDYPDELKKAPPHLAGTSLVQFITTSNITMHTLDTVQECYINLFTCKPFDETAAINFIVKWFKCPQYEYSRIGRGRVTSCQRP